MTLYGEASPPAYDISQIKDFPIALFCGREDLLSSAGDYKCLQRQLESTDSLVYFKEFDCGHLGFLCPVDMQHIVEMLELCRGFNPDYIPCKVPGFDTPEKIAQLEQTVLSVQKNIEMHMSNPSKPKLFD